MAEPNIEELRKNYSQFSDEKVTAIAIGDSRELRPEAQQVIREEIIKRNLPQEVLDGFIANTKVYTDEDAMEYCKLISSLPCPYCNTTASKLSAVLAREVISFLIVTTYSKHVKIGCPGCLSSEISKSTIKSALLGWWGIPWGIIRTIQAIYFNVKNDRKTNSTEPNDTFKGFVYVNIGLIEQHKNNPQQLLAIIRSVNSQ